MGPRRQRDRGERGAGKWDRQVGRARRARCGRRWAAARSRAGLKRSRPGGARASWAEVRDAGEAGSAWARAGLGRARGGKERKTGPAGERNRAGRRERGAWVGFGTKLGWVLSFISPFHFSILFLIQTTQIEFKFQFEFKPSTLKEQCTSMNATTNS